MGDVTTRIFKRSREAPAGPSDPAVEMPPCDLPPSSGQASAASESPPHLLDLMDEDWGLQSSTWTKSRNAWVWR